MKKTQPHQPTPLPHSMDLASTLEEHPVVQWLAANGKTIIYTALCLLALFILSYRFFWAGTAKSEEDFIAAQSDFINFQTESSTIKDESYTKLVALIDRHPELHAKYDGLIAQTLLDRGQIEDAKKFGESAIVRTESENKPYYTQFAETTLLIGEAKYPEALKKSFELKQGLQISRENNLLMPLNLLRIAMLQQQIGDKQGELQAWQEWRKFAALANEHGEFESFEAVNSLFSEGKISLLNYIETRERLLK